VPEHAPRPVILRPASPDYVPTPPPVRIERNAGCCWPIGDPRSKSFRFCGDVLERPGKPYCAEHARIAYPRRAAA
jgi:GcrA cell cycle regulator